MLGKEFSEVYQHVLRVNSTTPQSVLAQLEALGFLPFPCSNPEDSLFWALLPYTQVVPIYSFRQNEQEKREQIATFKKRLEEAPKPAEEDDFLSDSGKIMQLMVPKASVLLYNMNNKNWGTCQDHLVGGSSPEHEICLLIDPKGIYYSLAPSEFLFPRKESYALYLANQLSELEEPTQSYCQKLLSGIFNPKNTDQAVQAQKMEDIAARLIALSCKSSEVSELLQFFEEKDKYPLIHQMVYYKEFLPPSESQNFSDAVIFNVSRHMKMVSMTFIKKCFAPETEVKPLEDFSVGIPSSVVSTMTKELGGLGNLQYQYCALGFEHEKVQYILQQLFKQVLADWKPFFDWSLKVNIRHAAEQGIVFIHCNGDIYLKEIDSLIPKNVKEIVIETKQTLFLASDIKLPGTNLLLTAATIVALNDIEIDLSGEDAKPVTKIAMNGTQVRRLNNGAENEADVKGNNGEDGEDGNAGQSSGLLSIVVQWAFKDSHRVSIKLNGGNGGDGRDGGHGEDGQPGKQGEDHPPDESDCQRWPGLGRKAVIKTFKNTNKKKGSKGGNGGNGGRAGRAGPGGFQGELITLGQFTWRDPIEQKPGDPGKPGKPGRGGEGGGGGQDGFDYGVQWYGKIVTSVIEQSSHGEFEIVDHGFWEGMELVRTGGPNRSGFPEGNRGISPDHTKQAPRPPTSTAQKPEFLSQLTGSLKTIVVESRLQQQLQQAQMFKESHRKKEVVHSRIRQTDDLFYELPNQKPYKLRALVMPKSIFPDVEDITTEYSQFLEQNGIDRIEKFLVILHQAELQAGKRLLMSQEIRNVLDFVAQCESSELYARQLVDDFHLHQAIRKDSSGALGELVPKSNLFEKLVKLEFDENKMEQCLKALPPGRVEIQGLFLNAIARKLALQRARNLNSGFSLTLSSEKAREQRILSRFLVSNYYTILCTVFSELRIVGNMDVYLHSIKMFPDLTPQQLQAPKERMSIILGYYAQVTAWHDSNNATLSGWLNRFQQLLDSCFRIDGELVHADVPLPFLELFLTFIPHVNLTEGETTSISGIHRQVSRILLALPLSRQGIPIRGFEYLTKLDKALEKRVTDISYPKVLSIQKSVKKKLLLCNSEVCTDQVDRLMVFWRSVLRFIPLQMILDAYDSLRSCLDSFRSIKELESNLNVLITKAASIFQPQVPMGTPATVIEDILIVLEEIEMRITINNLTKDINAMVDLRLDILRKMDKNEFSGLSSLPMQQLQNQLLVVQQFISSYPRLPIQDVKTAEEFHEKLCPNFLGQIFGLFQNWNLVLLSLELSTCELSLDQIKDAILSILQTEKKCYLFEPLILKLLPSALQSLPEEPPKTVLLRNKVLRCLIRMGTVFQKSDNKCLYWKNVLHWAVAKDSESRETHLSAALDAINCLNWEQLGTTSLSIEFLLVFLFTLF